MKFGLADTSCFKLKVRNKTKNNESPSSKHEDSPKLKNLLYEL